MVTLANRYLVTYGGGNDGILKDFSVFDTLTETWKNPSFVLDTDELPIGLAAYAACEIPASHPLKPPQNEPSPPLDAMFLFGGMRDNGSYSSSSFRILKTACPHESSSLESSSFEGSSFEGSSFEESSFEGSSLGSSFENPASENSHHKNSHHKNSHKNHENCSWKWSRLKTSGDVPTARIGASVVSYQHQQIILFGGLRVVYGDSLEASRLDYYNDVHRLDLKTLVWTREEPFAPSPAQKPAPRESHSAVLYKDDMFIYAGSNGITRFDDLFRLHIPTMIWTRVDAGGSPPGRSLHSANLIGSQMFVFGGWISSAQDSKENLPLLQSNHSTSDPAIDAASSPIWPTLKRKRKKKSVSSIWKCSNLIASFDLEKFTWKICAAQDELPLHPPPPALPIPAPRAGHSAAAVGNRIYVFSGRKGYKKSVTCQVCHADFWMLETGPPICPQNLKIPKIGASLVELCWDPPPKNIAAEKTFPIPSHSYEIFMRPKQQNEAAEINHHSCSPSQETTTGEQNPPPKDEASLQKKKSSSLVSPPATSTPAAKLHGWIQCGSSNCEKFTIVKGILPETHYEFTIQSVNLSGASKLANIVAAKTKTRQKPGPVGKISLPATCHPSDPCKALDSQGLRVHVAGPDETGGLEILEFIYSVGFSCGDPLKSELRECFRGGPRVTIPWSKILPPPLDSPTKQPAIVSLSLAVIAVNRLGPGPRFQQVFQIPIENLPFRDQTDPLNLSASNLQNLPQDFRKKSNTLSLNPTHDDSTQTPSSKSPLNNPQNFCSPSLPNPLC